jgi:hypothetical protein
VGAVVERSSRRRTSIAALVALAAVTAGIGCGGSGSDRDAGTPTIQHPNRLSKDTSRTAADVPPDRLACDLLTAEEVAEASAAVTHRTPRLQAHASDSYQLSVCLYSGRGALVRVSLDGASDATRRYYNMSTEAAEIPKLLGRRKNFLLVRKVGDDDTYGGAGAYWQRNSNRLIAIHDDRIQRVTATIEGSTDRQRRALASRLARRVFARLDG